MAQKKDIREIWKTCSSLSKKAEELIDNKQKVPESIKSSLEEGFKEIIEFEKMYLISAHDKFYGTLLMSMNTSLNFSQRGPVDVYRRWRVYIKRKPNMVLKLFISRVYRACCK